VIGIRREDKNRWERRAPLTPDHVAEITASHGVRFRVQPSPLRIFDDAAYAAAGAAVDEDLAACGTILGIKEVPPDRLIPGAAYAIFAHVTKGQRHNRGLLRRILELGCTLLDHERIVDDRGRRLVFFGRHAGHAGMIDALSALGKRLEMEGVRTGLEDIRPAHAYAGLDEATLHVTRVGERMRHRGIPASLHPLVVAFTGSGNVTRGALEIFDRLPTQEVFPEELPRLGLDPERSRHVLYGLRLRRDDRIARRDWLRHVTVLVNGAFWEPGLPRTVTHQDLADLWATAPVPPLRVIADIACDVAGGVEVTSRISTPDDPVYRHDPRSGQTSSDLAGPGPWVIAVDNLPCELPVESSEHFGDALLRYVHPLDACDWTVPYDDLPLPSELRRALVVHRGRLTPPYDDLRAALAEAC
jgi:alpha-aminoadipic semialdehyde synthase